MPVRNPTTVQREQEEETKLDWLRAAVQGGIEDLDRGNYTTVRSPEELRDFIHQIRQDTSNK